MSNFDKVSFLTGMRRMLYAVTPNETSFANEEDVPNYIDEATPFFWVCMFLEIGISVLKQDKKYRMNDVFTSISAGMFSRLPYVFVSNITLVGYSWVYRHYCIQELPWQSPWTWWLAFIIVDMAYYWFHRMAHEVNFMWAAHQTHHSSEDYNLSTALRQSVFQQYTSWVFYLPMALFVPPSIFIAHQQLNILYQFWIHTEYIKSLGPLEHILNTPSHHRVHHGRNPYCIDKNYAGTLIIWDRLFGTFAWEDETVAYGLVHPLGTFEPFTVQTGYIKYLTGKVYDIGGLGNKLRALVYGPGWMPGTGRTGNIEDIPQVENPIQRYNVQIPTWMSVYTLVHFVVYMVGYQELMARHATLNQITVIAFVAYCFLNLTCIGRLFDNTQSAPLFEILRCSLFLIGDIVLCQTGFYGNKGYRPTFIYAFQLLYAVSIALMIATIMHRSGGNYKSALLKSDVISANGNAPIVKSANGNVPSVAGVKANGEQKKEK